MLVSDIPPDARCTRATLVLAPLLSEASIRERVSWIPLWGEAGWCRRRDGIYIVRWPHVQAPHFNLVGGTASRTAPEGPVKLAQKWADIISREPTDVVYVGKGNPISSRVRDLVRFGAGRADNHEGGEWIWQIVGIESAEIVVVSCPKDQQVGFENSFLERFKKRHDHYPLANRSGPEGSKRWWPGDP